MKKQFLFLSLVLAVVILSALYGCGNPSGGGGGGGSPWIYVSDYDNNSIMVINGTTNASIEPIPLGFKPANIAVSPDGKKLYVSDYGDDSVTVVDTTTNTTIDSFIPENAARSCGMAVSPNGSYLYMTSATTTEFLKISTTSPYTHQGVQLIGNGGRIALNATATKAYVCVPNIPTGNLTSIEVINLQTMTKEASINLVNHPHDITIKGNYAYVAMSSILDCVARINLTNYSVDTINDGSSYDMQGILSLPGRDKIYVSDMSGDKIYILIPGKFPTFEATYISSAEFAYPQFMAATSQYVYIIDAPSHYQIVVVNAATDQFVKYIYGYSGYHYYSNPVVVYK